MMDGYNNLMQLQNMGQSHLAPVSGGYGMIPSNGSPIMGGATHGGFPSPVGGQPVGPIGIRPQPFPVGGGGFGGTVQPQPMPHPPSFGGFGGSVQPQPWGPYGNGSTFGGFGGSVQPQPWGGGGGGLYGGPEPSPFGGNLNNLMMLQQMGRF